MGVVGLAALIANGGVALILYRFRAGDANMLRSGFARGMTHSAISRCWFGTDTGWPDGIVERCRGSRDRRLAHQKPRGKDRGAAREARAIRGAAGQARPV